MQGGGGSRAHWTRGRVHPVEVASPSEKEGNLIMNSKYNFKKFFQIITSVLSASIGNMVNNKQDSYRQYSRGKYYLFNFRQ